MAAFMRTGLRRVSFVTTSLRFRPNDVCQTILPTTSSVRHGSYASSPLIDSLTGFTEYEVFKNPPEWRYVESILPPKTVPEMIPKESYPSGWKPPRAEALQLPYFVARTRNHMLPVYMDYDRKKLLKVTSIKNIRGDIRIFEKEIEQYLTKKRRRLVAIRTHEINCILRIKGDFYYDVQEFLYSKGF